MGQSSGDIYGQLIVESNVNVFYHKEIKKYLYFPLSLVGNELLKQLKYM